MDSNNLVESLNANAYGNNNEGKSVNILERISTNIDEQSKITDIMMLKELINNLEKRDKEIILLRYFKEKTQSEVARIMGITQVQVSRLEKKILQSMKSKLAM